LNAVAAPGRLHELPGHCELKALPWHGAPAFGPLMQRAPFKPPQIPAVVEQNPAVHTPLTHCDPAVQGLPEHVPPPVQSVLEVHATPPFVPPVQRPEIGQSALAAHGGDAALLQVSQRHFDAVKPGAVQLGLALVSVTVLVPVELVRLIGNDATCDAGFGGQSRLVLPQKRFGEVPLTSHVRPAFGPVSHVPLRVPSFAAPSPMHFGHGFGFGPVKTREIRFAVVAAVPVSMLAVPLMMPLIWFVTQVATPPATSGRLLPK